MEKNKILSKEEKKKLSFKEKYGRCNSRNKRLGYKPIKDGYYNASEAPIGYNFLLGYTTDTIEMEAKNKNSRKIDREAVSKIYNVSRILRNKIDY